MSTQNVNVTIGGPSKSLDYTYKTVVLKSNLGFAEQIGEDNVKYVVKWNFDLGGQTIEMPAGCILYFDGGKITNGTLVGNDTYINGDKSTADNITSSVTLEGTWKHNAVVGVDGSLSDSSTNPVENKVVKQALDGKVDKVEGKGLSSNDYTDGEKAKLGNYPEYSSVSGAINGKVDKVEGKGLSDNNFTNDEKAKLGRYPVYSQIADELDGKVDKVVGKGLSDNNYDDTSKNKVDNLAAVATSGSYNDLTNKPEIPGGQVQADWNENDNEDPSYIQNKPIIPTKTSDLTNDSDFITENDIINLSEIDDTVSEVVYNPQSRAIEKTIDGKMSPVITMDMLKDILGIDETVNSMLAAHSSNVQSIFDAYNKTIADLTERVTTLEKKNPGPSPTPDPEWPTIVSADEFEALVTAFNATTPINGAIGTSASPNTLRTYLKKYYDEAYAEFTADSSILFSESTYPEIEDYRTIDGVKGTNKGEDKVYYTQAFRAMGSWLMAMCLTELYPSSSPNSTADNNQTILFRTAYNYGAPNNQGIKVKLYDDYHIHCDPMIARLAAGAIYAKIRGGAYNVNSAHVEETEVAGLKDSTILGSEWDDLGFSDTKWFYKQNGTYTTNGAESGVVARAGYIINALGYTVNTNSFLPAAPGPRVEHSFAYGGMTINGTTIVNPYPSVQCDDDASFNEATQNYLVDEAINAKVIEKYNMGSVTPQSTWDSYSTDKQQRLVQVGCTPPCSKMYMFGAQKPVAFNGIVNKSCINVTMPDGTVKSLTDYGWDSNYFKEYEFTTPQTSNLSIKGPFYMHSDLWSFANTSDRTTLKNMRNAKSHEKYIRDVLEVADNMRWPTYGIQYGRRRPGAGNNLQGYPGISTTPGDYPNEIYSKSLACLVPDDGIDVASWNADYNSGIASDAPTSYPSGHSSQIWLMAMALVQANPARMEEYMQNAYAYSVNRSIGRWHWNSDIIYGRLFGTITLPIANAMTGLTSGFTAFKNKVINSTPTPSERGRAYQDPNYNGGSSSSSTFTVKVVNKTGATVKFTNTIAFRLQFGAGDTGDMGPTVVDYRANRGTAERFTTLVNEDDYVEFTNLPILTEWVSRYVDRRFATQAELANYAAGLSQSPNVSVVDENGYGTTDPHPGVTPRSFVSTGEAIFKGGATYTIYLGGSDNSAYAAGGGASTSVIIRIENKTNSDFVFGNKAAFVLNTTNTNPDSYNNVRAKNLPLVNARTVGNVNTIASKGAEEYEMELESPNTGYIDYYFATKDLNNYELSAEGNPKYFYSSDSGDYYYSNILIYDAGGSAHNLPMPVMDNTVQLKRGKKYVIEYAGDSYVPPTPEHTKPTVTGGTTDTTGVTDVIATVIIKNESGTNLNIAPRVTFFTYGTYQGYTGYFRVKGNLSGNSNFSISNGQSQTYTVTFPKNTEQTPTVAVGMHFDPISTYNHYGTNNAFYIGGVSYKCINFDSNYQFKIGATYLMVIGSIETTG